MKYLLLSLFLVVSLKLFSQDFILSNSMSDPKLSKTLEYFLENNEARRSMANLIFAPMFRLESSESRIIYQNQYGTKVKYEIKENKDNIYILFKNSRNGKDYPLPVQGDYIIKRSRKNGNFIQVKIFIRDNEDSFLRIYPNNDRSRMDVYLYGFQLYRGVILPIGFKEILTMKFSELAYMSSGIVDWDLLLYRGASEDKDLRTMVDKIRKYLPELKDSDDGAIDAKGDFIYIETGKPQNAKDLKAGGLNCSGFAKWVVDGIYFAITGKLIDIGSLKRKGLDYRGNRWSRRYEDERDPYFGLDWSRNLAVKLEEARRGEKINDVESVDVRDDKFIPYIEDVGYPVKDLRFILFYLSKKYPGYFYIGSINREFGKDPILRQYFHIVVIFPYFTLGGNFRISVMERNMETSLDSLLTRYSDAFVHLVKVRGDRKFIPLVFE